MRRSIEELTSMFRNGSTDPVRSAQNCLERAGTASARSAFIALTEARALREANASLERYKAGRPIGRLDGIPISWKDVFDVAGTPTTAGSALRRSVKPAASDAPVVRALAQAGAVSIGKTNLSEFAFSGIGLNPHFGTPANLLVQGGIPGGSSSGAAVSVAIGACAVAFGTDTSGSIRVPAACNGLVGFKPTASRYPLSGVFPLAPSLDTVGIIAKSMTDIIVVDDVLTERQTKSPGGTRESATFVVPESVVTGDLEPAVAVNFEEEIKRLERAGFRIVRRRLKSFEGTHGLFQELGTLVAVEAAEVHRDILSKPELLSQIDQRVARRLQAGSAISAQARQKMLSQRDILIDQLSTELGDDLVIFPTMPHSVPLLAPLEQDTDLFARINARTLSNTMIGSFLDMPGVALPSRTDTTVVPQSILVSAPRGSDEKVLAAAQAVERAA
jgi:aspartyl-tRNA(Asn)/glutamyl-tRNA(Gln) amidotransferase subunit A